MLILVLINVQYIHNVVFSFEKSLMFKFTPCQTPTPDKPHPSRILQPPTLKAIWKTLDNWCVSYSLFNL